MKSSSFQLAIASVWLVFSQAFQVDLNSLSQPMRSNSNQLNTGTIRNNPSSQLYSALDLSVPVTSAMSNIDSFYTTAPYTAAFMTCGFKASAADFLAQTRELKSGPSKGGEDQSKEQIEFERNLAFILYGGIYQGMAQYYIYNILFPLWFGSGNDLASVTIQVAFDMLVISPFLCLPVAYLTKSTIYGKSLKEGLDKYLHDLRTNNLWQTYCSIWLPVQFVTFGLVPQHLRIAFIAVVSFFWLIILSTISSKSTEESA